jgi:hypothetical protein
MESVRLAASIRHQGSDGGRISPSSRFHFTEYAEEAGDKQTERDL